MTTVFVRTQFVGYHRWKDAPDHVAFLRDYHRHVFHVEVEVPVTGLNREVEFFTLKQVVDDFLLAHYEGQYFEKSCEMIANRLADKFNATYVEVSEDGENGARVRL